MTIQFDLDGVILFNTGTITIAQGTNLSITNTDFDAFFIDGGLGTINNAGTISIGPNIGSNGILVDLGSSLNLTNQASGLITGTPDIVDNFLVLINPPASSTISNFGTINVDMNNADADFFLVVGNNAAVINQAGGTISVSNVGDDAFNFDNGATLDNFGTITATNTMDQAFDISTPGRATNHASGIINIVGVLDEEGIDVTGTFINDGEINISGVQTMQAIRVTDATGTFTNNNIINVGMATLGIEVIEVDPDATLSNSSCGIINITTANPMGLRKNKFTSKINITR